MTIILSCGHKVDDMDDALDVATKEWSRECTPAIGYKSICAECYDTYESNGNILHTEQDEINYLFDK
jgi:hypothetical protein